MSALLHMLGLDADHRKPWRNHFVAGPGHHSNAELAALVEAGHIAQARTPKFLPSDDVVYVATEAGIAHAIAENYRANPVPPMAKRRYLHWLRISDVAPDLTFREYLRRKMYADPAWGSP